MLFSFQERINVLILVANSIEDIINERQFLTTYFSSK